LANDGGNERNRDICFPGHLEVPAPQSHIMHAEFSGILVGGRIARCCAVFYAEKRGQPTSGCTNSRAYKKYSDAEATERSRCDRVAGDGGKVE
jgi:hypothetical protein